MATITGTTGNDVIISNGVADTLIGLAGNDVYIINDAADEITEAASAGTDSVISEVTHTLGANVENLFLSGSAAVDGTGNADANTIIGNSGINTLTGALGADYLDGGADADELVGGAGNDTYVVDDAGDVVTEVAAEGTDTVRASIDYVLGADIENLVLLDGAIDGTGNADANTITGNAAANTLAGMAGADVMIGAAGDDLYIVDATGDVVTEVSGEGTDTVQSSVTYTLSANVEDLELGGGAINGTGNAGVNTITGGAGANTLDGGAGADELVGLGGDDVYIVDDAGDVVTEGAAAGTDSVQSSVTYTLGANVENLTLTGSGNINATGNGVVNTITGNAGNNVIDAGVGADTMIGLAGNDSYVVDNLLDVVTEGAAAGTDSVSSSVDYTLGANVENLTITGAAVDATGNAAVNVITGNANANTIDGGAGADTMIGAAGNDLYIVDATGDVVTEVAAQGTDTVESSVTYTLAANVDNLTLTGVANINATGNADVNTLTGNTGNNTLDGGVGADEMVGDDGDDTYVVDDAGDVTTELAAEGNDTVRASLNHTLDAEIENLTLTGTGNFSATGNTDDNIITGNSGSNAIDGDAGADTMIGLAGNDSYTVDDAGDVITETASGGTADSVSSADIDLSLVTFANVENATLTGIMDLDLTGSARANTLTGNVGNNSLDGGLGNDRMVGGDGDDTYVVNAPGDVVVEALGEGDDTVRTSTNYTLAANVEHAILTPVNGNFRLTGNALDNDLTGNAGANRLDGGAGADNLVGGAGNDTYIVDDAGDTTADSAAGGRDTVYSSATSHTIGANIEALILTGTAAIDGTGNGDANTITGNSGANVIDGGVGADLMNGAGGNDTLIVDNIGDNAIGGAGTDLVESEVTYTISATVENLTLTGVGAINGTGNSLANTITGNGANNTIDGKIGNDVLIGGAGDDILFGRQGTDTLTGGLNDDTFMFTRAGGYDTITDFAQADDIIDLSDVLTAYDPGDVIAEFVRFTADGGDAIIEIDANGTAGGVRWVAIGEVTGGAALDATTLEAAGALFLG